MKVEIHTSDWDLIRDLLGKDPKDSISSGTEVQITDQIKLKYEDNLIRKGEGFPVIHYFTLFASGVVPLVAADLIARWLWEKFKGRKPNKLIIEKTEVEFEEGKVKKAVQEKLELEQS